MVICPQCHADVADTANFCEECGAKLPVGPVAAPLSAPAHRGGEGDPCANCGAAADAVDPEGFCLRCGHQRRPPPRDHVEWDGGPRAAGVSDRGARHFHNEDAFAVVQCDGWTAAVLCDGVSNSPRADEASAAAARSICDALTAGLGAAVPAGTGLMASAVTGAHEVVLALAGRHGPANGSGEDAPATTAVAALVRTGPAAPGGGREAVLGWLGDSRVYFVDARGGARLLTRDHSWINEAVDAGRVNRTEALRSRHAHTVTRTLGGTPDEAGRPDAPSTVRVALSEPGWLILCTDGLWNYAPEPPELAGWVRRLAPADAGALDLCRALVAEALRQGGRDNVTVVALAV